MAVNQQDLLAEFRTGGSQPKPGQPPAPVNPDGTPRREGTVSQDLLGEFRFANTGETPNIRREDNTLGEEFVAGLGSGIDGFQASLSGVAGLAGRELGIKWLEDAGNANAAKNFEEAARNGRQSQGFTDIESAGGFFKWTSATLGEAIPSLAFAMTGGGLGLAAGRKSVELGVKKSIAKSVERRMAKLGFGREESMLAARDYMTSSTGQTAIARAFTQQRTGKLISAATDRAEKIGQRSGVVAAASLPQIGAIDQELVNSGVADPGLTALLGGVVGGALEAVPALRLMDKMFPGVERQVSKAFVKDFAISTGTQLALEGSTEGAQEIITLAALAYNDPTFDMFSPDARKRVIDAFAAGAVVGAVTGGGAEAIGAVTQGARGGSNKAKAAIPIIGAWSMAAKDKVVAGAEATSDAVEARLPEGFVPADKTLFEEVKNRINSSIQPHIEAAVNSMQGQIDKVSQSLNDNLEGGVNAESASVVAIAQAAHNKFLEKHKERIAQAQAFMDRESERITRVAKTLKDPETRAKFIEEHTAAVKEKLSGYVDLVRREAAKRNETTQVEVDNMDIDNDMLAQLGIDSQQDRDRNQQAVDDAFAPQSDKDAQVGQVDSAPILTFGKFQFEKKIGVDGKNTVQGYDTKKQAELGRRTLRKRFRNEIPFSEKGKTQDDSFRIVKQPDGTWVIEVINQDVKDSQKFFNDLESARASFSRVEGDNDGRKVELGEFDGERFGFQKNTKNLNVDVQTMAFKGKNLDPEADTDMKGLLAFAGELLSRGMINNEQFAKLQEAGEAFFNKEERNAQKEQGRISDEIQKAEAALKLPQDKASGQRSRANLAALKQQQSARKSFDQRAKEAAEEGDRDVRGQAPPIKYATKGQALGALSEFKKELADARPDLVDENGKLQPERLFDVKRNRDDGTWSWGFNQTKDRTVKGKTIPGGAKVYKSFKAKSPLSLADITARMEQKRRDEFQDRSAREEGAFSVNQTLGGRSATRQGETAPIDQLRQRLGNTDSSSSGDLGDRTGDTSRGPDVNAPNTTTAPFDAVNRDGTPVATQEAPAPTGQRDFGDAAVTSGVANVGGKPVATGVKQKLIALQKKRDQLVAEFKALPNWTTEGDPADQALKAKAAQIKVVQDTMNSFNAEGVAPNTFPAPTGRRTGRTVRVLEETRKSQQKTDKATNPAELEPEFEADRKQELKGTTKGKNKFTSARAKKQGLEQTERDNKALARLGRPGSVKMMILDGTADTISAITALANFVTKTLGLSNQVVVMDNAGLQLMIERGLVTNPIFEQTLNDPNVHARNIRDDNVSFVYLSPTILSDPVATTVAFGHEMGHHLYRVAWDKLTPEGQARLKKAYQNDVGVAQAFPGLVTRRNDSPAQKAELAKLKKRQAVLEKKVAPIVARREKEAQFGANEPLDSLTNSERELNDVEGRIQELETTELLRPTNDEAFNETGFNEWMADQLAAWIVKPRLPQTPAESFFAKVGGQIRRLYDFIKKNKRFELNETFNQFADAVALKAANPQDAAANPYNDAQIKAWFRNEGVTMYGWFGEALVDKNGDRAGAKQGTVEVDNIAFDFTPVTQEGKDALARVEKKYPLVAKRANVLKNWITSAYNMAIAPATSVMRDIGQRVKTANKVADMFHRGEQGAPRAGRDTVRQTFPKGSGTAVDVVIRIGEQTYSQAILLMRGQFMKPFLAVKDGIEARIKSKRPGLKKKELQTLVDAEMRKIAASLTSKDSNPDATFTTEEQVIRNLFDDMHKYAVAAGLPVDKVLNYFPRQYSRAQLTAGKQAILDHLTEEKGIPLAKARHIYNALIDPHANDGRATRDATETPGFKAMNSRNAAEGVMGDPFFDQFQDDNLQGIVANYVNQVIKRSEFNRRFGEPMQAGTGLSVQQAITQGVWHPKRKLNQIMRDAKNEGASDTDLEAIERYIDANLGQLGRDSAIAQPGPRRFMAAVMAYQNMRVLLFTVFASLPDGVGPAIRSGSMKNTWKVLKSQIGDISSGDSALAQRAHALGIVQDAFSDHMMTEYVDNHYMPAKLRSWNDSFFKYTGLNWYTDFTRKYALAVGIDYIEQSYNDFVEGDTPQKQARGKDMLAELGMSPKQAKGWIDAGKPTYDSQTHTPNSDSRAAAEALIQFVDESIMRPNASQRPIMASHPGAMLVFHLKGYMYAVHDIVLKRLKFNIDEAQSPAQYAAAIAPAIAMMLLTAVGLELRELIQYAGSNRKPPTDRMDGWEYTWELAQRSGLTGIGQIGFDFQGAEDRGMSHVAGIGGPALAQAADIISKPSTQTIPKAIPVIGQIPAARALVRDVIR
jgi:hypothetical protein